MKTTWTKELIDYLLLNYQNEEIKNISKKINISVYRIRTKLKEFGKYKKRTINQTKEELERIYQYYLLNKHLNSENLGKMFKISRHKVADYLRDRGVTINPHGKFGIDSKIFSIIDTEEKAYWLGFLYADGNVHKNKKGYYTIELGLKEGDVAHVEKFKDFLKSEHFIKYRSKTKSVRLIFSDQIIANDLIKLGCIPNKSLILKFPTEKQVPNDLIRHFIRGYVDGDGYISKRISKVSAKKSIVIDVVGTYEFLETMCKVLHLEFTKIIKKDKRHLSNTFSIGVYGENARNLGEFLYKNATIYLDRKKETFEAHPKEIWHNPVLQYDLSGNFIKEHYNGATASRNTGLFHSSISLCCKGKAKQCGGFIFKFKYNE